MKTNRYLLPTYFKVIGWVISVPSALTVFIYLFSKPWDALPPQPFKFFSELWYSVLGIFSCRSLIATICMVLLMIGLLFIAFSKEKMEDEYIIKLH